MKISAMIVVVFTNKVQRPAAMAAKSKLMIGCLIQ